MPKTQALTRTCRGLYTRYNPFHEAPEGALLEARNIVVDGEGRASPRRGLARYGITSDFESLFEFQDKLIGLEGTTLRYDADGQGAWAAHAGFAAPDSATRMRSALADLSLLISTSKGVYSTDLITSAPVRGGMPSGLDTQLALTGNGLGWFLVGTQVAYRIVWGRNDKNNRLKLGAPSMRKAITNATVAVVFNRMAASSTVTVTHTAHGYSTGDTIQLSNLSDASLGPPTSTITVTTADAYTYTTTATTAVVDGTGNVGKTQNATVTFTMPKDVVEGDFYEVYRTSLSATASTDPGDRCKRVARLVVTAANITSRDTADVGVPITFTDTFDPAFLGEELYTNSTRDGIAKANSRPPWCRDLVLWKDHLWYLNTRREELVELQLIDSSVLVADTSSVTFTIGATVLTYTASATENISTRKFKKFTTGSTLAQNIRDTMESLVKCINRDNDQTLVYAYYVSGITDPPGAVAIEPRSIATVRFYITANDATAAGAFSPTLPTSGTLYSSDNETMVNGLYRSKFRDYEAVPEGLADEIGDPSRQGLRIIPLKDSLIIVKEDGIWRVTGESQKTFSIKPLETTLFGRAPATWVSFDNAAWGLSTQGIVRVTESGAERISRPIDDKIAALLTYPNVETLAHATAYESEGLYLFACQKGPLDTQAEILWVFNNVTETWTGPWTKPTQCGHVLFKQDRLFLSHTDDNFLLRDRKSFDITDFMDEEIDCTITAVGTVVFKGTTRSQVTVTFVYSQAVQVGWLFRKNPTILAHSRIDQVDNVAPDTYVLTLAELFPGLTTGTGAITLPIDTRIVWKPEIADNLGVLKHFTFLQAYFGGGNISRAKLGTKTDVVETEAVTEHLELDSSGEGVPIRIPVTTYHQRARSLTPIFEHAIGRENYFLDQLTLSLRTGSESSQAVPR